MSSFSNIRFASARHTRPWSDRLLTSFSLRLLDGAGTTDISTTAIVTNVNLKEVFGWNVSMSPIILIRQLQVCGILKRVVWYFEEAGMVL